MVDQDYPSLIIVLCPSYEDAEETYDKFISYLACCDSVEEIDAQYDYGLCVALDSDLTYIFIDEHWKPIIEQELNAQFIDYDYMETFLEDLFTLYNDLESADDGPPFEGGHIVGDFGLY